MTYAEFLQEVEVTEYHMDSDGIKVTYSISGATKTLTCTPEAAAELLKGCGFIDKYYLHPDGSICIYWCPATGHRQTCVTWADFIKVTRFSQYWAIQLAVKQEMDVQEVNYRKLFQ